MLKTVVDVLHDWEVRHPLTPYSVLDPAEKVDEIDGAGGPVENGINSQSVLAPIPLPD